MDLETAVETYAKGYALLRSRAYPCQARRHGDFWVLMDHPIRVAQRVSEVMSLSTSPQAHLTACKKLAGPRWVTTVVVPIGDDARVLADFKAEGFKQYWSEPMFTASTKALFTSRWDP